MGRYPRNGLTLIGVFLLALLAGCGTTGGVHQADAFGTTKTYAVVIVMANEKVGCSDLGGNPCNGGIIGLVGLWVTSAFWACFAVHSVAAAAWVGRQAHRLWAAARSRTRPASAAGKSNSSTSGLL